MLLQLFDGSELILCTSKKRSSVSSLVSAAAEPTATECDPEGGCGGAAIESDAKGGCGGAVLACEAKGGCGGTAVVGWKVAPPKAGSDAASGTLG